MYGRAFAIDTIQPGPSAPAADQPCSPAAAVKRTSSTDNARRRTPDPKAEARAKAFAKVGRQVGGILMFRV